MKRILLLLALIPLQIFAIEFVTVKNPNNKTASNGKGRVPYIFQISKFEITNAQYCEFLNSVAVEEDKYDLFSPLMEEHFFGGIIKKRIENRNVYTVKTGYDNLPIIGVTWMSAVRYCNWLHYNSSRILTREQYLNITEGNATHGAYDTRSIPLQRNEKARYWLPNENEWLKAAYFNGSEWDETFFPKGSNCYMETGWAYPFPHLKPVGLNVQSSHYGTFDQQGNAAEWIENMLWRGGEWKHALGGSVIRSPSFAAFNESEGDFPDKSITTFGLRICRSSDSLLLSKANDANYVPNSVKKNKGITSQDPLCNDYVLIGDAFNRGDCVNRFFGRVNYDFYIARTELSNDSYCSFLNAVAKYEDPYGLYDENMEIGACGGINRKIENNIIRYSCKKGWEDKPVVYVNYYDICRYSNWLHYGCPQTGKCKLGTTEGTAKQGAYNTEDFEVVCMGHKSPYESFGKRNVGARFWIPSENEWYKAAYYDPTRVGNRKYHDYPTRTSDAPSLQQANYMVDNHLSVGAPFYVAPVDSFPNSPSYYGTLQQGGNVWEWIEDWQYGIVGTRGLRGGSWSYTSYGLNACNTDPGSLNNSGYVFGARICMAASDEGWRPVTTPVSVRIYEYVMLMPQKHLLLAISLLGLMAIIGIASVFAIIFLQLKKLSKQRI